MKRVVSLFIAVVALALPLILGGCKPDSSPQQSGPEFKVLAGSENKTLEPVLQEFARQNGVNLKITYKGSVDIMLELEKGKSSQYDAILPADRIWIELGDKQHVVKNVQSIYRSPVIFGVKRSVAQRLGWIGKDVTVADILAAAKAGKLRYMMTSATQSNSGAAAYIGYLYAFAGNPDVLSISDLRNPKVADQTKQILGSVNRTSGSSGWLKDLFLDQYDVFDAMVNYEAVVIETNQVLQQQGREPLYAVYPKDGLSIADAPLGYISKGDAAKDAAFQKLETYLTSAAVQDQLKALGRRTGLGVSVANADPRVFDPALGFDTTRILQPITMPPAEVIQEALMLYQTAFRKPSLTVFVLDFSGSMQGTAEQNLKSAMRTLLDQQVASRYMLQQTPKDITIVIPFDGQPRGVTTVKGNKEEDLQGLIGWVQQQSANGGTDFYRPVAQALGEIAKYDYENYNTSIIVMSDGRSEGSIQTYIDERSRLAIGGVPIYSIAFGDADTSQMKKLATESAGKVFDGKTDLISAFREAKGYNN